MIGKRKFHKIVLSSAAKNGKMDRDKFRSTTRVVFSSKESSKGSPRCCPENEIRP